MRVIREIGIFAYVYLTILLFSLLIFWVALRSPKEVGSNMLEIFKIDLVKEGQNVEAPILGALISGVVLIGIMVAALVVLVFLAKFGKLIDAVFVVFAAGSAWELMNQFRLRERLSGQISNKYFLATIQALLALIVGSLWLVFPSWVTYDLTFAMILYGVARTLGTPNLATMLIVLAMVVAFDVWGVWGSGLIVEVATQTHSNALPPPLLLIVPKSPLVWNMDMLAALGAGDVVFSAIMVATFARYNLAIFAMIGYGVGLLVTFLLPISPFPATLTLVPSIIAFAGLGYIVRRVRNKSTEVEARA